MAAGYEVLDVLGHDRTLIRITSGAHAGTELVVVRRAIPGVQRLEEILGEEVEWTDPDSVAEQLLVSLLDQQQRHEWDALRTFWVDTKFGRVRLGRLYDITFRPDRIGASLSALRRPRRPPVAAGRRHLDQPAAGPPGRPRALLSGGQLATGTGSVACRTGSDHPRTAAGGRAAVVRDGPVLANASSANHQRFPTIEARRPLGTGR